MSIEREGRYYKVYCDICLESDEEEFDDFDDAVAHKKVSGYVSRKEDWGKGNDGWYDVCPECQKL